jgi:hypothetical protein
MLFLSLALALSAQAAPALSPSQQKTFDALRSRAGTYRLSQDSGERPCRFQFGLRQGDPVSVRVAVVEESNEFRKVGDIVVELVQERDGKAISLFDRAAFVGVNLGTRRTFLSTGEALNPLMVVSHAASYDESTATHGGFTYDYSIVDRNTLGFITRNEAYDHCEFGLVR